LVSLNDELTFLNHYIYLLSIRFEKGINFNITIDNNQRDLFIIPMCLQILVENTIQHNEISIHKPLTVEIYTSKNSLIIENKIQLRRQKEESSQIGLENIKKRFAYFTNIEVEISNDGNNFKVILPLISKK
jgi:LytS/YehU family sensor histidine kinase